MKIVEDAETMGDEIYSHLLLVLELTQRSTTKDPVPVIPHLLSKLPILFASDFIVNVPLFVKTPFTVRAFPALIVTKPPLLIVRLLHVTGLAGAALITSVFGVPDGTVIFDKATGAPPVQLELLFQSELTDPFHWRSFILVPVIWISSIAQKYPHVPV